MGGFGSGRWQSGKPLTSERVALDIRAMQRPSKGCGTAYVPGQDGGSLYVSFQESLANVEVRLPGQATQRRLIGLDRTKQNFGGYRNWWKCPCCRSRVGVLYWDGWRWQCRQCAGLVHESTRQTEDTLAYARVERIRDKLRWGGGMLSPIGDRPKGMHIRTFARLVREFTEASIHAAGAGADRIDMLVDRLEKLSGERGVAMNDSQGHAHSPTLQSVKSVRNAAKTLAAEARGEVMPQRGQEPKLLEPQRRGLDISPSTFNQRVTSDQQAQSADELCW